MKRRRIDRVDEAYELHLDDVKQSYVRKILNISLDRDI